MDWLTFATQMTEALAWPVAAVVILIIMRRHVAALVPHLRRVKAGPLEAEFERELQQLRAAADVQPTVAPASSTLSAREQVLFQLAEINPRSAILEAWQHVEIAARRRVLELGLHESGPEQRPLLDAYRSLAKAKVLPIEALALFHELRSLRNQAAHVEEFNPTKAAALDYLNLCKKLVSQIEALQASA